MRVYKKMYVLHTLVARYCMDAVWVGDTKAPNKKQSSKMTDAPAKIYPSFRLDMFSIIEPAILTFIKRLGTTSYFLCLFLKISWFCLFTLLFLYQKEFRQESWQIFIKFAEIQDIYLGNHKRSRPSRPDNKTRNSQNSLRILRKSSKFNLFFGADCWSAS